jgi:hypothetical protein
MNLKFHCQSSKNFEMALYHLITVFFNVYLGRMAVFIKHIYSYIIKGRHTSMVWSSDFGLGGPRFESRRGKEKNVYSICFLFSTRYRSIEWLRWLTREKFKTVPIMIKLAS